MTMTPKTIQRLDQLFTAFPVLVGGPAAENEIDVAEKRVGIRFVPDYRDFLACYGGAVVGSLPVLGLRQAQAMGDDMFSVVDVTAQFRPDGWTPTEHWAVIPVDLAGNPIGITPEGSVWISDHDAAETRMMAFTFEDFLRILLDSI